jgi:hypothetical protein
MITSVIISERFLLPLFEIIATLWYYSFYIRLVCTVLIGLLTVLKYSIPMSLPILRPYFISYTGTPAEILRCAIFIIYPINIEEVVVPSPANLFVPSTECFIKVETASGNRSS